jgi:protein-S-isoprenylcysteine O-methyltransferase Ste14
MDIRVIAIIAFSYIYAILEIFLYIRQRSRTAIVASKDKGSLWVLSGSIAIGYSLSFAIGATKFGRVAPWSVFLAVGAALVIIGLVVRISSILTLRQYFTYSVAKVENHALVQTGLYKIIRHPGYLGQLLIFLGLAAALSNWLAILLMMIPVSIGYIYRMNVEERFMAEQLGQPYLDYRKRTKRIIPAIY